MNPPPLNPVNPNAAPPPSERSGLALASLILGIAGIVLCLGPLAGIPAVICGHIAHSRIKKSGGAVSGDGLAVGGLITGYISIAMIAVMGLLAAIAIPNFVKARNQAMLNGCRANMRVIEAAKSTWALENRKQQDSVPADGDLFGPAKSVANKPVCPAGGVYQLNAVENAPSCSIHGTLMRPQP